MSRYSSFDSSATTAILQDSDHKLVNEAEAKLLKRFAVALALCHNLGVETSSSADASIEYRAESPDEAALAVGAAQLDVVFLGRKQNRVIL